jgi:hypothetical protein
VANYVRRLTLVNRDASVDDCSLPQVRYISLPGFNVFEHAALINMCGPTLKSIHIADPHTSSSSDPYDEEPPLRTAEVTLLARLPSLVTLRTEDIQIFSGWEVSDPKRRAATMQQLSGVPDLFPSLRALHTEMCASTLPLLLPLVGRLTTLQVRVDQATELNVLQAVADGLPLLQVLQLKFLYHGHSSNATVPAFLELQRLVHLRVLEVDGLFDEREGMGLTSDEWAGFVGRLCHLECLKMPHNLALPSDALRVLGENCRRLSEVSLRGPSTLESLDGEGVITPCFPSLTRLRVKCFGDRQIDERYVCYDRSPSLSIPLPSLPLGH